MVNRITSKQGTDERELGKRFRDGDETALDELHRRYFKPLRSFVYKHTGATGRRGLSDSAAFIATNAFMNAWRYRATFKPEKKFFTWICEIAKNASNEMLGKPPSEWGAREFTAFKAPAEFDQDVIDPFTFVADRVEAKYYSEGMASEADWDDYFEDSLDDDERYTEKERFADGRYGTDELSQEDVEPRPTDAEFAEMEAQHKALLKRLDEAFASGGIIAYLKVCLELFPDIKKRKEKYPIHHRNETYAIANDLRHDIRKGLFPARDPKPAISDLLTPEQIENNKKIFIKYWGTTLPGPGLLFTESRAYQRCTDRKLSLLEVLILYWRKYPKTLVAKKLDMEPGTLRTAMSRIKDKFPDSKRAVKAM